MKKSINSIISILLVFVMLIASAVPTFAAQTAPTLVVDSMQAVRGQTATVKLSVQNNPGMAAATFRIVYDSSILRLDSVNFNTEFGGDFDELGSLALPVAGSDDLKAIQISWSSLSNITTNGTFLSMNFVVKENAEKGSIADVFTSFNRGDFCNIDEDDVNFISKDGQITIIEGIPGDINGDKVVNSKDLIRLRKYFGGFDVEVDIIACDCNGDGNVNSKDLMRLRKYFSGWDVELFYGPSVPLCRHSLTKTETNPAKCEKEGNIVYWYCNNCNKYFADENAATEITLENTVIAATGHTIVIDPEVSADYDHTGLTEGSHCSVCNTVIKAQEIIPKLEKNEYSITYHLSNGDEYLAQQTINNTNPNVYTSESGVSRFNSPSVPGYQFLGWYDLPSGAAAENIKSIPVGTTGNIDLYARWEKTEYTVQFDSPDVPVESITYTVDKGVPLINPAKQFGYTFVGWSNDDGFLISSIKLGTVGNITLHANWTSNRNKATSYESYDDPMIVEDDTNGQFMFVYNIGKIDNVPLNQISYLGNSDGIEINQQYDVSSAVTEETANQIANTVANATTKSSGWTLSDEWGKIYSTGSEEEKTKGKTTVRTDSEGNVTGGNYFVSNSSGGSSFVSNSSGGSNSSSSKVTTNNSVGINKSYDNKNSSYVDAKLSASNTTEASAGVSVPIKIAKVEAGVKNTTTVSGELAGGLRNENSQHYDDSYSGSVGTYNENNSSSYYNSVSEKSSTWNSTSGYEKSYQTSRNTEVSNAISEQISKKTTLNVTDSVSGSKSTNATDTYTDSSSEEYSSSVRYNSEDKTTTSQSFKYSSTEQGYYRLINAGTVHVFAVVAYDVATSSYYTYTYNVLDDERHIYTDFSLSDPNFKDCENGVVSFEVPYEVNEYVMGLVGKSNGLQFSLNGTVTKYTSNTADETVVVPQYYSANNGADNSKTAIKVTKISPTAFKGNTNIKTVVLPLYIDEIPDGAFEGCTNLENVIAFGVTKIGANAFKGCTNLTAFSIDNMVTSLGYNAFENVNELRVQAANESVFDTALSSGAKRLTINTSLMNGTLDNKRINIASDKDYFALLGNGSKVNDLQISSRANETYISNMTFANNTDTPLKLNSKKVTLNRVVVEESPGFALILENDNTELSLYGTVDLGSSSENAILARNISLVEENAEVASEINSYGDVLVCDKIRDCKIKCVS